MSARALCLCAAAAALTLLAATATAAAAAPAAPAPADADYDHSRPYADIGVNLTRAEVRQRFRDADTTYFNTLHHQDLATFLLRTAAVMVAPFSSDSFSLVESRLGFGKCASGQIRINGMCMAHG